MLNNSPWLRDRALEDISDMEADLIAGGQVIGVDQLLDVSPAITKPNKKRAMSSTNSTQIGLAAQFPFILNLVLLFPNPFAS
ncbi:MAG: hypothetical protein WBA89_26620 [Microcoleus sp.]|uniref:hypothetical protein n=1 Tax=Microcoleus sp. TaxID=44472 RepID=UPI003C74E364